MPSEQGTGPAGNLPPRRSGRARTGGGSSSGVRLRIGGLLGAALCSILLAACGGSGTAPRTASPLFREAAEETGLEFEYFLGADGQYYLAEINGGGVALFDYDGDGDLDVYFPQGRMLTPGASPEDAIFPPPKNHWPGNRLFRNELVPEGKLRFTDVTEQSGAGYEGYCVGATVGDYDGDGDPDLYVTCFGPNVLYRNNGDGTFTDVTAWAGVNDTRYSTGATFFDYDKDGDLDLYLLNYVDFTVRGNKPCYDATGARDYCSPTVYNPLPDRFFRNDGPAGFTDVSREAGLEAAAGNGLGVAAADLNGDSWIDVVVANDQTPNLFWVNQGDGTFEEAGLICGLAYNANGQPESSMSIPVGDYDGDGDEDVFATNIAEETSTLYANDGTGIFEDVTEVAGLAASTYAMSTYGSGWFDYDHDGRLDLFNANGAMTIVESQRGTPFPFLQPNQLFWNTGQGRFQDVTEEAGPSMLAMEASRGAAFGDIDRDGDLDIVVSTANGPARLYLNEAPKKGSWLLVKLRDNTKNVEAVGARVALLSDGRPPLWRRVRRDGSYASSHDIRVHFGLGGVTGAVRIGVIWPDGTGEVWEGITPGREILLRRGTGAPWGAT